VAWFWIERSKVNVTVIGLTAIRRGFELCEYFPVSCIFDLTAFVRYSLKSFTYLPTDNV